MGAELLAVLFHNGAAVPVIWIVGLVLIVAGVISMDVVASFSASCW